MDITLEKSSSTEASIKIRLDEADYQPKVEQKIKEYSKKANIKGFRPGKAPSSLIRKLYGKGLLVEELNQMLVTSLNDYIKENDIKIIGEPLPKTEKAEDIDWDSQKVFEFEYEIGIIGDFNYSLDKNVTQYEVIVEESTVAETVENLKVQYGQTINPETSENGDYLYGELKEKDGDIQRETVIALFEVAEKARNKFIGLKPTDEIEFDIQEVFTEPRLIGLVTGKSQDEAKEIKGKFSFIVNKIDRRVSAEMNQEFFDRMFGKDQVKSEEEFKAKIAENLKDSYSQESDHALVEEIRSTMLDETPLELPDAFLKKWLMASNKGIDDETLSKEYDSYKKELKWSIIRNKIADDLQIKIEKEDLEDKSKAIVRDYLRSSGMPPQFVEENIDKLAENYLQGSEGKNYMNLYEQVKNEKIIDAIKERLQLEKKTVTVDEFRKALSN